MSPQTNPCRDHNWSFRSSQQQKKEKCTISTALRVLLQFCGSFKCSSNKEKQGSFTERFSEWFFYDITTYLEPLFLKLFWSNLQSSVHFLNLILNHEWDCSPTCSLCSAAGGDGDPDTQSSLPAGPNFIQLLSSNRRMLPLTEERRLMNDERVRPAAV